MVVKSEALLATAAQVLAAYPGASLADVAAAAGVSRTTIFSRYPTRAALLEAVALDGLSRLELAYDSIASTAPAVEVLTDLVRRLIPMGPHIAFLFRERALDDNETVQLRLMSLQEIDHALLLRAQAEEALRRDAPVAWLSRSLDALVYAAWEGVDAGELAALDAAHHVMAMFLGGAQPRP
jgi:AcrR family transcriptional regulator